MKKTVKIFALALLVATGTFFNSCNSNDSDSSSASNKLTVDGSTKTATTLSATVSGKNILLSYITTQNLDAPLVLQISLNNFTALQTVGDGEMSYNVQSVANNNAGSNTAIGSASGAASTDLYQLMNGIVKLTVLENNKYKVVFENVTADKLNTLVIEALPVSASFDLSSL